MLEVLRETWSFAKWWIATVAGFVFTVLGLEIFFSTAEREWLALPYALGGCGLLVYGAIHLIDICVDD